MKIFEKLKPSYNLSSNVFIIMANSQVLVSLPMKQEGWVQFFRWTN